MKCFFRVALIFLYQIFLIANASEFGKTQEYVKAETVGQLKSVVCPGEKEECVDDSTCCKLESGDYGCCPYDNAVCCSDKKHCCPQGFTCNVTGKKCSKKYRSIKSYIFKKINHFSSDSEQTCSYGTPCLEQEACDNFCCPFKGATCCSDKKHCCPSGYTCDLLEGKCKKRSELLSLVALTNPGRLNTVECPGGKEECPDGTTCCKLPSGKHGCCPHLKATCCADGKHCCPHGYRCNSFETKCVKRNETVPFSYTIEYIKRLYIIICPGNQDNCPNGNTCCKSTSGGYGCCPIPHAVCCSDGKNCCPNGYICNSKKDSCDKKYPLYFFREKPQTMKNGEEMAVLN